VYRNSFGSVRDVFLAALSENDVFSESVAVAAHRAALQTMTVAFRGQDSDAEVITGQGSPKRIAVAFVTLFNECITKELAPLKVSMCQSLRRDLQNSISKGIIELNELIKASGIVDPADAETESEG
jgi:hypothetical protein